MQKREEEEFRRRNVEIKQRNSNSDLSFKKSFSNFIGDILSIIATVVDIILGYHQRKVLKLYCNK